MARGGPVKIGARLGFVKALLRHLSSIVNWWPLREKDYADV